mmetsp:Transcript_19212/g.27030  ORF Transcript_19212/g.27030 Transcript_19212/m.27030 type:complete len:385 (+) Transcript_19212:155-1309(+)|eukprot:CAMPEP_0184858124 /NCGR_PEP_ID=MMETSP0580-20130426/3238_1 /TAXON_ID=1118495 /ORGANISM="Dactyliosolen fragilissimus" /LENGTH=384 /DNA_ID=CAMNT_0027354089 /DNA_START=116 /DNA_END=1270 /DNA_ORIENTATION=+
MPGPKMGPRPDDFDEGIVKKSPTFIKWNGLSNGQRLRYACREFIKGSGDDEERLMRRIMIARRNNLRDHDFLKRARKESSTSRQSEATTIPATEQINQNFSKSSTKREREIKIKDVDDSLLSFPVYGGHQKKRRYNDSLLQTDSEIRKEMDLPAVESTRSFKHWIALADGEEFTYNQRYIKGREGHEWLLKKNIWRRMRYRRANKKMVLQLKQNENLNSSNKDLDALKSATDAVVESKDSNINDVNDNNDTNNGDLVSAALAAAELYVLKARESESSDLMDNMLAGTILDLGTQIVDGSIENVISDAPDQSSILNQKEDLQTKKDTSDDKSKPQIETTLVTLDGHTLDVAAKLAAAACASTTSQDSSLHPKRKKIKEEDILVEV